jgi:DNA-binding FadR family transcriptional regulator
MSLFPTSAPPGTKTPPARFRSLSRSDGLVDRVVKTIQTQILTGRLPVGAKLPPERDFSERLGVSRTVVREAVRILVTRGLLQTRHGIGTTVRTVTREEVVRPLTLFLRTCGREVSTEHLHQVRSILEVENAGLGAEQASEADIEDLRRILNEMEFAAADPPLFALRDSEFHRRLAETTHNPLLILLLESIQDLMTEVRTLVAQEASLFQRVMPTHLQILECIAARDARGARRAMREHIAVALEIQNELVLKAAK